MRTFHTLAALGLLALAAPLQAQTNLTLTAGINQTTATAGAEGINVSPDAVTRFAFGASLEIPLHDWFRVHAGPAYSQKGWGISSESVNTDIDYLELSVLGGVPLALDDRATLHFLLGSTIGFMVSCSITQRDETEDCDAEDLGPKSTDFGAALGARVEIGVSDSIALTGGLLYNLGITNLFQEEELDYDVEFRNRVLMIQAGITVALGG